MGLPMGGRSLSWLVVGLGSGGLVIGAAMLVAALALRVARGARRLPCAGAPFRALASKALGPEREMEALTHFCRGVRGMLVENAEATGGNPQTAADVLDVAACVPRLQALRDEGAKFLLGLDDKPHPLWAAPFLSAAFEFEMMQAITTGAPPAVPAALTELTEASADVALVHYDDAVRARLTFDSFQTPLKLPPMGRRTRHYNALADALEARAAEADAGARVQVDGYAVVDSAFGDANATQLANAVRTWLARLDKGAITPGELDATGRSHPAVRDDVVAWLAGDELDDGNEGAGLLAQVLRRCIPGIVDDQVNEADEHEEMIKMIEPPSEEEAAASLSLMPASAYTSYAMVAAYAPGSRGFARHADRSDEADPRLLTAVYYLNEMWDANHGGALVLYPGRDREPVRVAPKRDTLVLFNSEMEHEVEAVSSDAPAPRLAVSVWCL